MSELKELTKKYSKVMIPCEVCDSEEFEVLQRYGRIEGPGEYGELKVSVCKKCGYRLLNPRYEDSFYEDYYRRLYRDVAYGSSVPSSEYIRLQQERGGAVLGWLNHHFDIKPGVMLDHGCASGFTMLSWINSGWVAKGFDPHLGSVERGREIGLDIELGVGERLPYEDDSIDVCMSLGSLEHTYDIGRSLSELHRVLRESGLLFIRWRSDKIYGSPLEYYNHNHNRFFSHRSIALLLARYGFEVIQSVDDEIECEGSSFSYTLASKAKIPDFEIFSNEIFEDIGTDDPREELEKISALRDDFYTKSKRFLEFYNRHSTKDISYIRRLLEAGESGLSWDWISGFVDFEKVYQRKKMEAERYISLYDQGMVV